MCEGYYVLYGSEMWAVKVEQVQRIKRAEMPKVRWMCGTKVADRIANEELGQRLGLHSVKKEMETSKMVGIYCEKKGV